MSEGVFLLYVTINVINISTIFNSEICNCRDSGPSVIETILRHTDMSYAAS